MHYVIYYYYYYYYVLIRLYTAILGWLVLRAITLIALITLLFLNGLYICMVTV